MRRRSLLAAHAHCGAAHHPFLSNQVYSPARLAAFALSGRRILPDSESTAR